MDALRFDALAKIVHWRAGSRRAALRVLAGSLVPAAWGGRNVDLAAKKKKPKKKPCPAAQRCGRKCCAKNQQCVDSGRGRCVTRTATNPDPICAGVPSCCSTRQCDKNCLCQTTAEGGGFCFKQGALGCGRSCATSADCPDGVCIFYGEQTTCGQNVCCGHQGAVCVPNSSRCGAREPTNCPTGWTRCNGQCVVGCCGGTCQQGQSFLDLPPCTGNPENCRCLNAILPGGRLCAQNTPCDELPDCTSNDDCDTNVSWCAEGCCGTGKCFRFCGV